MRSARWRERIRDRSPPRYHDVRGDAYFAKKDPQKAAEEYKAALARATA